MTCILDRFVHVHSTPTNRRATPIASSRRFSISFLMAVVALIAADLAIITSLPNTDYLPATAVTVLPIVNVLILTVPRLGRGSHQFWIGFHVVGWATAIIVSFLGSAAGEWLFWIGKKIEEALFDAGRIDDSLVFSIDAVILATVYATPLVLLSMLGGRVSARWARGRANDQENEGRDTA